MINGLYTAATGMMAVEARHDVIANNIANAATTGYKRQSPVQLGFYEVFSNTLRQASYFNQDTAPGGGVKFLETYPKLGVGMFRDTDNPLHMALQGPGYFTVETPEGERFTRSGEFGIDTDGHLATTDGFKVQSVNGGPINARGNRFNVGTDGAVTVDDAPAGQLRIVEFGTPERLERQGNNLFRASQDLLSSMSAASETQVAHGNLELSNVNLPEEMTAMMLGMRAYEANQRVIEAFDSTVQRVIEQVGMPS